MARLLGTSYHSLFPSTRSHPHHGHPESRKLLNLFIISDSTSSLDSLPYPTFSVNVAEFCITLLLFLKEKLPALIFARSSLNFGSIICYSLPHSLKMLFSRSLVLYTILLLVSSYADFIDAGCAKCRHSSSSLNRPKRKANEDNNSSTESITDDSEDFTPAEMEGVRLEYIKQQILQRLGMSKAPNVEKRQVDVSSSELQMLVRELF
jgi:hypothetical protein